MKDLKGGTIGVGKLGHGVPGRFDKDELARQAAHQCTFAVLAPTVPARERYRVQVGRQPETTVAGADSGRLALRSGS